jgi:hypothetical protein
LPNRARLIKEHKMAQTVADQMIEVLAAAGVKAIVSGWGDEIVKLARTRVSASAPLRS